MEVAYINESTTVDAERNAHLSPPVHEEGVLVQGSTWSVIWRMSWPLTVNMLALSTMNLFEGWIAARLGADAQAAMGISGQLWFLFMMMTLALSAGTTAVISRFCGAGDVQSAVKAGRQALLCAIALSIVATIIGLLSCRHVLHALGASNSIEEQGVLHLSMTLVSMVPYTVLWISNAIFRASGNARTPMVTMMWVFALIMLLELVFCLGPFQLGVRGVGIAWTLSSLFGLILNLVRLKSSNLKEICNWRDCLRDGFSVSWAKQFLVVGIPSCLQDLALIGGSLGVFLVLSKTQNPLVSQAAWAAGWRLEETLTLMPMYGLNLAAAAIVGQNLGARKPERAASCGWRVMALGAAANILVALVMFFMAPNIAALLCADGTVSSSCVEYLRIVCWTEPLFACWRILSGAMQGAGYTYVPMCVTVFSFAILRVSLAAILSQFSHGNSSCIWLSMAVSTVVAGVMMIYFWNRGNWKV